MCSFLPGLNIEIVHTEGITTTYDQSSKHIANIELRLLFQTNFKSYPSLA